MFYAHILKMKISGIVRAVLLFADSLLAACVIIYAGRRIIALFYQLLEVAPAILPMSLLFALIRTVSLMNRDEASETKPGFGKILLFILLVGALAGGLVSMILSPRAGLSPLTAAIYTAMLFALLAALVLCAGTLINGNGLNKTK